MNGKQVIGLALLAVFYGVYFIKQILQRQQGIRTNQIGQGNKLRKTLIVEKVMGVCSIMIVFIELGSIFLGKPIET